MLDELLDWFCPYWTPINFFYYALISNVLISLWDLYLHYRQVSDLYWSF